MCLTKRWYESRRVLDREVARSCRGFFGTVEGMDALRKSISAKQEASNSIRPMGHLREGTPRYRQDLMREFSSLWKTTGEILATETARLHSGAINASLGQQLAQDCWRGWLALGK